MANMKVTLDYPIINGQSITIKTPCDCTEVTGLIVYYPVSGDTTLESKVFTFRDAHGNDLATISDLFTSNTYIKVIVDTDKGHAYLQNADTNAYLEGELAKKYSPTNKPSASNITGLATVATSGSYNDLSNKPTIPTVNNATLTIQKNGTNVATFTANSSSNATANITVPTKTSELTNDSGFKTTDNNTTYTFATGDSNGQIKVTPSSGSATNVSVKGLGSAAYTASTAYATASHNHAASEITSGTLGVARGGTGAATATANYVFAAPNGSAGAPAFRKLVSDDIPSLATSKITSGTLAVGRGGTGVTSNPSMLTNLGSTSAASVFAASPRPGVTGTLGVANGGTGQTTLTPAVGTAGVRSIYAGTSDMTAGSSSLTTGAIYFVYE